MSNDYNYLSWSKILGNETIGTAWSNNKLEATTISYAADSTTGKTWISTGETIGIYDPTALTHQMAAAGAWVDTIKLLWMVDNGQSSKLQSLNIPCVQVGSATLTGSNSYITSLAMNDVRFFSNSAGDKPTIWATGSVTGSYSGNPAGSTVALSGGGLNANFNVQRWYDNKWAATVTNGSGALISGGTPTTYTKSIEFRGAGAGSYTGATSGTLSGTAAGVVKR